VVNFALGFLDETGATRQAIAQPTTLGYLSLIFLDEAGAPVETANSPGESPPDGESIWQDEFGNVFLVPYSVLGATGVGPLLSLPSFVGTTINKRWRMAQLGDTPLIGFPLRDANGPIDLTGALLLEGHFRRPDHSLLVKNGSAPDPINGQLEVQLDSGDVNGAGEWLMQAHVVLANGREFSGEVLRVKVELNA